MLTVREFHAQKRSNNRSGVPGVCFLRPKRQPAGKWQAITKLPNGKFITKSFAVLKYGDRGAFRLAVAARLKMLERIEDRPYLYHRTAKRFASLKDR